MQAPENAVEPQSSQHYPREILDAPRFQRLQYLRQHKRNARYRTRVSEQLRKVHSESLSLENNPATLALRILGEGG